MAVYKNTNTASTLAAVEFTPVSAGNFSFFYVDLPPKPAAPEGAPADAPPSPEAAQWEEIRRQRSEEMKSWLTSKEVGQKVVAETMVNGQAVLVTQGGKTQDDMLKALEARGDRVELKVNKKPLNYWAVRGGLSVVGQTLHLASAILGVEKVGKNHPRLDPNNAHYNPKLKEGMYVRKKFQADIGMFAILNQTANFANIVLGGQKEKGDNRLHAVKEEINQVIGPQLAPGDQPIAISEDRSKLREGPQPPESAMDKAQQFARENSVRFFEIFLRVLGTTALIVPWRKDSLGKGMKALQKGQVAEAWNAVKNKDRFYYRAGWSYLTGKALSFAAKTPDPYSDEPHTALDTIREKYLFKAGTAVEFFAASQMAYNAFTQKKMGFYDPNRPDIKPMTDVSSGIGGSLFAIAFIARFFAPFGKKSVNMEEVYAHATDTLAKLPQEKMLPLVAETSAKLTEHFQDKPGTEFGEIFTKLATDLYRYHPIALDLDKNCDTQAHAPQPEIPKPHIVAGSPSKLMDRIAPPADNHAEQALKSATSQLSASL